MLMPHPHCMEKNIDRSSASILHKTPPQMNQGPRHKTDSLNLRDKKVRNSSVLTGTGDNFLNGTSIAWTLRPAMINDLMELESFCGTKHAVIWTKQAAYRIAKDRG